MKFKRLNIKDDRLINNSLINHIPLIEKIFKDIRQINPGELIYLDGQNFVKEKFFNLKLTKKDVIILKKD